MPTYKFLNTDTHEEFIEFMGISEMETYLSDNKNIVQLVHGAPAIGDSIRLGLKKPDDGFRDILRNIKKKHSDGITKSSVNIF